MGYTKAQEKQRAEVAEVLEANFEACVKSLLILYKLQEADEQRHGRSYRRNGKGFGNHVGHSDVLNNLARKALSNNGKLDSRHHDTLSHHLKRYWRQLHKHLAQDITELAASRSAVVTAKIERPEQLRLI